MSDTTADIDRVWTLINDIPVAMVVTHDGQGQHMRARPVATRPAPEEAQSIWALTLSARGASPMHLAATTRSPLNHMTYAYENRQGTFSASKRLIDEDSG
jgi:hypothetical protein